SALETWPVVIDCDRGSRAAGAVIGTISFAANDLPVRIEGFHTLPLGARQSAGGFAFDEITLGQFLAKLDYLAYYDQDALPVTAIGKALEMQIPVLLPPEREAGFGKGPIYVRQQDLSERLTRAAGPSKHSRP